MAFAILVPVLGLLIVDALIEVSFLGSMIGYLHKAHNDKSFEINCPQGTFQLFPKPAHLIVNQGHTTNGAAGSACVVVGICGLIVLFYVERRDRLDTSHYLPRMFLTWTIFTIFSAILTLVATIYTFLVSNQTESQTIEFAVASANSGLPYPEHKWTPENWYEQVLKLPFADLSQISDIRAHLRLMSGWRWNLIPLLILGVAASALAVMRMLTHRARMISQRHADSYSLRNSGFSTRLTRGLKQQSEGEAKVGRPCTGTNKM